MLLSYPELVVDERPSEFVPKLYGFKIFGHKGSKFQLRYDENGQCMNQEQAEVWSPLNFITVAKNNIISKTL